MYETGMGAAIALPKQSLAQKIAAARAARGVFVSKPIAAKKITPPISVLKKPVVSVLKLPAIAPMVPVEPAMPVSMSPMSAPMVAPSVASGSGSGGSSFSPAGDGGDSESETLPDATSKLSPVVLIAIGAAALFFLSKKGR